MKLDELRIKNFKGVEYLELKFNNEVTRLVGLNGSGKTTIFEAIWAGFKGISEKDQGGNIIGDRYHFIGSKAQTAKIDVFIKDENRTVSVTTTISKSGNIMEFRDENGLPIDGNWVKNLLDVTMMNATQFCKLTPKEQAIRLGIDLSEYNKRSVILKNEFTETNAVLRALGSIKPVDWVERVSIDSLIKQKEAVRDRLNEEYEKNKQHNEALRKKYQEDQETADLAVDEFNLQQEKRQDNIVNSKEALNMLKEAGYEGKEVQNFINSLPVSEVNKIHVKLSEPKYIKEKPDESEITEIDKKIKEASVINERASEYEQYLKAKTNKEAVEKKLVRNKSEQLKLESEKLEYIKSFKFGFTGLEVDDEGGLILNKRAISTYSKSEKEIIVARLAESQNPEFKVRLIDEFQTLDESNQEKLINELLENGYQLLIAEVGKLGEPKENTVYLNECKIFNLKEAVSSIDPLKKLL